MLYHHKGMTFSSVSSAIVMTFSSAFTKDQLEHFEKMKMANENNIVPGDKTTERHYFI